MPTVEVDLVFFIFTVITSVFALPFILFWTFYKAYKSPEFWLKIRRADWVYILMKTPLGKLPLIIKTTKEIAGDGWITLFGGKRKYCLRDTDEKGRPTVVQGWKHKKPLYVMHWKNIYPLAWVDNPGLDASGYDPGTVNTILDNKIMEQIMNADFTTGLMKAALVLACMSMLVSAGVIFMLYGQSGVINHTDCIIRAGQNATLAARCG